MKLAAASIVAAPLPCLSGEALPRALWLQRDKEWGLIDVESGEGYRQACWLLRDTQAGQTASASMRLLQTAAWMQAFFAAYQIHRPFVVHSGFRTKFTHSTCGGAKASLHKQDANGCFHAMDIHMDGIPVTPWATSPHWPIRAVSAFMRTGPMASCISTTGGYAIGGKCRE